MNYQIGELEIKRIQAGVPKIQGKAQHGQGARTAPWLKTICRIGKIFQGYILDVQWCIFNDIGRIIKKKTTLQPWIEREKCKKYNQ